MLECPSLVLRARSSMAEQRPFKPFVEGSIPSALINLYIMVGEEEGPVDHPRHLELLVYKEV